MLANRGLGIKERGLSKEIIRVMKVQALNWKKSQAFEGRDTEGEKRQDRKRL